MDLCYQPLILSHHFQPQNLTPHKPSNKQLFLLSLSLSLHPTNKHTRINSPQSCNFPPTTPKTQNHSRLDSKKPFCFLIWFVNFIFFFIRLLFRWVVLKFSWYTGLCSSLSLSFYLTSINPFDSSVSISCFQLDCIWFLISASFRIDFASFSWFDFENPFDLSVRITCFDLFLNPLLVFLIIFIS